MKAAIVRTPSGRRSRSKDALSQALLLATKEAGHQETKISHLLFDKADPNVIDDNGYRPLHYATQTLKTTSVEKLLTYKADPNTLTPEGQSALELALDLADGNLVSHWFSEGQIKTTPVSYTIEDGAMTFRKKGEPKTIARKDEWLIAYKFCPQHVRFMSAIEICVTLIQKKAKLDLQDKTGIPLLQRLADLKSPRVIEVAKRRGLSLPKPMQKKGDPQKLRDAALRRDLPGLQKQLTSGADPNATDEQGRFALYFAAQEAFAEGAKALLKAGADPSMTIHEGFSSLHVAIAHTKNRPINFTVTITKNKKKVTLTDPDEIRREIGSHPDDEYNDCVTIVKLLLKRGANVDQKTHTHQQTPLSHAASYGTAEIVTLLASSGAELNSQDKDGLTPLHFASRHGHLGAVSALLKAGANPNIAESYGFTPLHEAAENNRVEVVKALLKSGADKEAKLSRAYERYPSGATSADIASAKKNQEVVELLVGNKKSKK